MDSTFLTRARTAASPRKSQAKTSLGKRSMAMTAPAAGRMSNQKKYHIVKDPNRFGAESPMWTIPSSRHPEKPPPDYPPPGYYDVPLDPFHTQLPHTIREREWIDYSTITSNIELLELSKFPEKKTIHIGNKDNWSWQGKIESPGPSYMPHETTTKKYKIASKYPELKPDPIPGPSAYEPKDVSRPSSPAFKMPKAKIKRFNDDIDNSIPGPGAYQIGPKLRKAPRWSQRLRVRPRKTRPNTEIVYLKPWETSRVVT